MAWPRKLRHIRSGGQEKPDLLAVFGILIILIDALTNLSRGNPNNGVGICVVIARPLENFNTEDAFFELAALAIQRPRDHKPQELPIPFAGMK